MKSFSLDVVFFLIRMDPTSVCRLAIRVPAYVEQRPDGLDDYHVTANFMHVVDKDIFSWMGFYDCFAGDSSW